MFGRTICITFQLGIAFLATGCCLNTQSGFPLLRSVPIVGGRAIASRDSAGCWTGDNGSRQGCRPAATGKADCRWCQAQLQQRMAQSQKRMPAFQKAAKAGQRIAAKPSQSKNRKSSKSTNVDTKVASAGVKRPANTGDKTQPRSATAAARKQSVDRSKQQQADVTKSRSEIRTASASTGANDGQPQDGPVTTAGHLKAESPAQLFETPKKTWRQASDSGETHASAQPITNAATAETKKAQAQQPQVQSRIARTGVASESAVQNTTAAAANARIAAETGLFAEANSAILKRELGRLRSDTESLSREANDALITLNNAKDEFTQQHRKQASQTSSQMRRYELAVETAANRTPDQTYRNSAQSGDSRLRVSHAEPGIQRGAASGDSQQWLKHAESLYRAGNYAEAELAFRKVNMRSMNAKQRLPVQYMVANSMRKQGRLQEATVFYQEIADSEVDDVLVELANWQLNSINTQQRAAAK